MIKYYAGRLFHFEKHILVISMKICIRSRAFHMQIGYKSYI